MSRASCHCSYLTLAWLLMFVICLATSAPSLASAQSADETGLRSLAEKFFTAYQNSDLDDAMRMWSEKSPHIANNKQTFQQTFAANKIEVKNLTIRKISVENGKATVQVVVDMSATDIKTGKPAIGSGKINRTLYCVKESVLWKIWQYVASEQELAAALATAKTNEDRRALLETEKEIVTVELVKELLTQGRRLHSQGNYQVALDIFMLAMITADQMGNRSASATALRGIGIVHYSQGNYLQALEDYQKSLRISEEMGDNDGIAGVLNNIGLVHYLQDNHIQALEYFRKSLRITEKLGAKAVIAITLNNIANVHHAQGNYIQALEYYQRSLKIKEELGGKAGIAVTQSNIGQVHYAQSNYIQALEYYQKSLKISEEISDKAVIAITLNNIGLVHHAQGDYIQALKYFQQGLKISEEISDKAVIARTLNNIGLVHYSQVNYIQALEYFQKSLRITEELGAKNGTARALNNIGIVHYSQGGYTQAIEMANRAAIIAEQIGSQEVLWQIHSTAGKAYYALHRLDQARQEFELAIASIEGLRSQIAGSEQDRQQFFEGKLAPYHHMLQLLIEQDNPIAAFAYAERAKARALLDTLQTGRVNITRAMTVGEQELERQLNAEVMTLNAQIYRENLHDKRDERMLTQLNSRLEKARLDYEAFYLNLYVAHPELKVHRGQMQPISLGQSDELIPDAKTALLEYVVTEDKAYLFVLTRQEQPKSKGRAPSAAPALNIYTLNIKQKDLADRVEYLRQKIANTDIGFRNPARELYELLVKPAALQLWGKTRLIIVPDGSLWNLPFQALLSGQSLFLIEDYSIAYAHSLTALHEMIKRHHRPLAERSGSTLLALGNPVLSNATVSTVKPVFMGERLDPLPEAEKQVRALGRLYGVRQSKIYIGAEASEERFKAEASSHSILHLATHGILNERNPMYSYLLLSQTGGSENEDGLLEAWELMKLDLKADLVVLSACETARGRAASGEGVIGLSWALFVAGVPTTVVSQWKVESASTAELMVEFHRQLKLNSERSEAKTSKAEALRGAALKLLRSKQYSHPFYWGGFVLVGDGF